MGIGSSASKATEVNPSSYNFSKALEKSITSQEGNYVLYLFENKEGVQNNGGCFEIILYNPIYSAKCFRLLVLNDSSEAKEKLRYKSNIFGCRMLSLFSRIVKFFFLIL